MVYEPFCTWNWWATLYQMLLGPLYNSCFNFVFNIVSATLYVFCEFPKREEDQVGGMVRALCVGEIRAKCQKTKLWQNTKTQWNKYFCNVRSKCQESKWRITGEVKAQGQIFLLKAQNWMFWWNLFLFCNIYISNIHIQEHISVMI